MLVMVDIDSTLYEANSLFRECSIELGLPQWPVHDHWNRSTDVGYTVDTWGRLFSRAHDLDRIMDTTPYWGALETLDQLDASGATLWYVSNRKPESKSATEQWLVEWNFPQSWNLWAQFGDKVAEWIEPNRPDIVIDDRVKTAIAAANLGCEVVMFEQPHNVNMRDAGLPNLHVCRNWVEVRELLNTLTRKEIHA